MRQFARVLLSVGLLAGCSLSRSVSSARDAGPEGDDAGMDAAEHRADADTDAGDDAFVPSEVGVDGAPDFDGGSDDAGTDAGSDAGSDVGPCPSGPTGSLACPFTTLSEVSGLAAGIYSFTMAGLSFRALIDDGGGGGWMLVASADETAVGLRTLTNTASGPVTLRSHSILAPAVIAALPDANEVRIDSSPGSTVMASVRSTDAYVLGQLRGFRSLHAVAAEAGTVRWNGGDAGRMTSTCANVAPAALDRMIFQTCGAGGNNLHWAPSPTGLSDPPDRLNTWVYRLAVRDRLNLWVRR